MAALTPTEVRRLRARAQGLSGDGGASVPDAVRLSAGLQAQDVRACRLQVRARTRGLRAADVDASCAEPVVVRSWLMRGTLHAVAATDLRWLTALLGPRVSDSYRGRRQRLGLDDDVCGRALPVLERALSAGEPLTREELVARLKAAGIPLDPAGQAPAHLLLHAAARGLICRGPEAAGDTATYVLTERWLAGVQDRGPTGDDALAELAVRHTASYGPASAADLARWSGLPLTWARRGLIAAGARVTELPGPDGPLWSAADAPTGAGRALGVRMTGHFDPYLLGYADRDALLPPAVASRIATGGGFLMPCVLHDGAVAATWRHQRRGQSLGIRVESLVGPPSGALAAGIDGEVADIAHFLGVAATWEWAEAL